MQKPVTLLDATFDLFGFLPEDDDSRWPFLVRYAEVKSNVGFRPMNFYNAWRAIYLSGNPSYKNGFVTTATPPNVLQLHRAVDNLSVRRKLLQLFPGIVEESGKHDMRFAVTDSLTTDPTRQKKDITPCPEALYQIRLFDGDRYLARLGFNIHHEDDDNKVMSIVNIQGRPDNQRENWAFQERQGISPFNLLVRTALSAAESEGYTPRGLIDPARGNSKLYWGVLTTEGVEMYHRTQKPSE
jgi:hypothetical protein